MKKWKISGHGLAALTALYSISVLNLTFWRYVRQQMESPDAASGLFFLAIPIVFFLVTYAFFGLLVWPYMAKPLLAIILVASAVANYFMYNLNVLIDLDMLRNVFATNPGEAAEMITPSGMVWTLLMGVLPAALLSRLTITYARPLREVAFRALTIVIALALAGGLGLAFYKEAFSHARNDKRIEKILSPSNYITAIVRYVKKRTMTRREFQIIDEAPNRIPDEDSDVTVIVLMIGETARAMNFSLNGYERETNPRLAREDVISFKNVASSGTATAFSLPCMFSHLPRTEFTIEKGESSENLLDVLQKAGYDILWFENDGGSKGVSNRVPTIDLQKTGNPAFRNGDTFYDEVLLDGLEDRLRTLKRDTILVLHMMGSHGPSYYRRYPDAFRVFTPTCDTAEIQGRPREEIVNTYDNTILYTDHVIAETIGILKRLPQHESCLLYVSDHGESLGENGLYLHGFPYSIAPREQAHVPMILWMSELMRNEDHIDFEKLRVADGMELSHDNLFHSILGLGEIESELYDPAQDFFRNFRTTLFPSK